jgi:WD40 repeat protein
VSTLWDLVSGDSTEIGEPGRLQFSPDGNTIVILTRFGFFTHDIPAQNTTREHLFPFWNSGVSAFHPDGQTLAIGDGAGDIRFYETIKWKPLDRTLEDGHSATVFALGIHPDGDRVYSVGADRTIRQWKIHPTSDGQVIDRLPNQSSQFAISPDGESCATGSPFVGSKIWGDGISQRFASQIDLFSLGYSSDGRTIAGIGRWDSTVCLFDSQFGKELYRFAQLKHWDYKLAIDDGCLAAGGKNGEVILWRTSDGVELDSWTTTPVNCIAIRPHSDDVVTGHDDGVIRCWKRTSDEPKVTREYHTHQRVLGLRFTPDGQLLLSTAYHSGLLQIRAVDQKHEKPLAVIPIIPEKVLPGSTPIVFDIDSTGEFIIASGPTSSIYIHRISRDLWNHSQQ